MYLMCEKSFDMMIGRGKLDFISLKRNKINVYEIFMYHPKYTEVLKSTFCFFRKGGAHSRHCKQSHIFQLKRRLSQLWTDQPPVVCNVSSWFRLHAWLVLPRTPTCYEYATEVAKGLKLHIQHTEQTGRVSLNTLYDMLSMLHSISISNIFSIDLMLFFSQYFSFVPAFPHWESSLISSSVLILTSLLDANCMSWYVDAAAACTMYNFPADKSQPEWRLTGYTLGRADCSVIHSVLIRRRGHQSSQ